MHLLQSCCSTAGDDLTLNGGKKNIKYILKKKVMFVYKAISALKYKVIKKNIRKE